jgi:centromere protein J
MVKEATSKEGKTVRVYQNGRREIIFANGTRKETFPDGYNIIFFNN